MGLLGRIGAVFRGSKVVSSESEQKSLDVITLVREGFTPANARSETLPSGLNSNVVMAPVMWVMRTFTEAQAVVQRRRDERVWDHVVDHALEQLIDEPNDYYDGDALWKATVLSYMLDGNAYWYKVRNVYGNVLGLWYLPHWTVRPAYPSDGRQFISHYDYASGLATPDAVAKQIPVRDIVHFRFGLNPDNPRFGLSPLRSLLAEVMTDEDASDFSRTALQNMGIPGLLVTPKDSTFTPNNAQRKELQDEIDASYTGRRRSKTLVLNRPADVSQFGFDANKIMLANLRDISEERVCAVLGIPAAVVGFGSGLQSTKVGATMRELRRLAWVQCLLPMQKSLAKQVTKQLLPDFQAQTSRFRVRFDDSDVSAFQEDDDLFAKRVTTLVQCGLLRVDRAQQMLGLEVDETQQVYIRPANAAIVDEHGDPMPSGATPAVQAGTGPAGDSATDGADTGDAQGGADDGGNDPNATDDLQKMLDGIVNRLPRHVLVANGLANGNGKH